MANPNEQSNESKMFMALMNGLFNAPSLDTPLLPQSFNPFAFLLPQQFNNEQYYTPDNKEIIESHLRTIVKTNPLDTLLYKTMDEWIRTGNFISLDDLINIGMTEYLCHCPSRIIGYDPNFNQLCKDFMKFFIVEYGDFPQCFDQKFSFQYYQQEKKFALPDQLETYMRNFVSHMRDPLNTGCESKHKPTKNLEKLKSYKLADIERKIYHLNCLPFEGKMTKEKPVKNIILNYLRKEDEKECCLCQSVIKSGDKCFILPCSHIYHADESEDCGGLTKWLSGCDTCCICRAEIKIE
jgi:hypothetical protein